MKKIIVLILVAGMLASCNNGQNSGNNNGGGGGLFGGGDNKKEDNNGGKRNNARGGGWSSQDRNQFLRDCNGSAGAGSSQAKQICECVLSKLEAQYTSLAEADRLGGEAAGTRMAQECAQNIGGGDYNDDDNYDIDDERSAPNTRGGGNWTSQQRQQYASGCVTTAQQSGLSSQQARSYCDCMVSKVMQRYSFSDAAKLTSKDLQRPEWQQAAADCMGGGGYDDDYDNYDN